MSPTEVAPDVWRITTPLPFRPREVHAYLLRVPDGSYGLVDGGIDTPDAWRALDEGVRAVAGEWARVSLHVVTHMHLDHMGLARRTREAGAGRLLMSRLDGERVAHAQAHPREEADFRRELMQRSGAPAELIEAVQQTQASSAALAPFQPPDELVDGERGRLEGAPGWLWLWTPGHTAGHISLFRERDRVLVAGDAVLPRVTPTIGVNRQRVDPVGDYLRALDALAAVQPGRVLAGHGEPLTEPAARIRELRNETRSESQRVLACVTDTPRTAWTVALCRHPDAGLPAHVRMLALRETLAHLEHLAATGVAREIVRPDDTRGWLRG